MTNGAPTPDDGPLSRDAVHSLLADERRRTLLRCLGDHGPLAVSDLADEVARAEHDSPLPQIPDGDVLCVYLSLWHCHLPKLAQAAVVDHDRDRDLVTLGENAACVADFAGLDLAVGEEAR